MSLWRDNPGGSEAICTNPLRAITIIARMQITIIAERMSSPNDFGNNNAFGKNKQRSQDAWMMSIYPGFGLSDKAG